MKGWLIASYYTSAYRREAMGLASSLDALGLSDRYVITFIEDRGSWVANCAHKPTFIRHQMVAHDCPVVWLDADARVRAPPVLFDAIPAAVDVACHYRHDTELLSGTLYFNDNSGGWELLGLWERACQARPGEWDQRVLQDVIESERRFNVMRLPSEYVRVFDDEKMGVPVIEHLQASRKLAKVRA